MKKLLELFSGKRTLLIRIGIGLLVVLSGVTLYLNRALFLGSKECVKCEICKICEVVDEGENQYEDDEPEFYISPEYKLMYMTEIMMTPKNSITNFKEYAKTNQKEMIGMVLNKLDYFDQVTKTDDMSVGGYVTKSMFDKATLDLFGEEIALDMTIVNNDIQSGTSCAIWNYNSETARLERGENGCGGNEDPSFYTTYKYQSVDMSYPKATVNVKLVEVYQEDYIMDETDIEARGTTDIFNFFDNGVKIGTLELSNTGNELTNRLQLIQDYIKSIDNKVATYRYTYEYKTDGYSFPAFTKYEIIK